MVVRSFQSRHETSTIFWNWNFAFWDTQGQKQVPKTKSRFWSKKNLKRKLEFWSKNEDLGVFDIADFKFLGLDTRFERNWRNRFWIFKIWFLNRKFQIAIQFQVLRCRFCIFLKLWGAGFVFFWKPNFPKIEISNFGRVDFCNFINFWPKFLILEGLYTKILLSSR